MLRATPMTPVPMQRLCLALVLAALDPEAPEAWAGVKDAVAGAVRWDATTADALLVAGQVLLARNRGLDAATTWDLAGQHRRSLANELGAVLALRARNTHEAERFASRIEGESPRQLVLRSQVACSGGDAAAARELAERALRAAPCPVLTVKADDSD